MPKKEQQTALISVYDKTGIADFAKKLNRLGFSIIASGGTAKEIAKAGVKVTDVAELVGGGAILGHRVVTLSREIHAGLLADYKRDKKEMQDLGMPYIDLVCVDLYPLEEEIAKIDATRESVIEKTDIGGPAMLRSAAKGRRIVISNLEDREKVLKWLKAGKPDEDDFIENLVAKAEAVSAAYAMRSASYHGRDKIDNLTGFFVRECKYGENGWQTPAALFTRCLKDPLALEHFELAAGEPPSYNNLCDLDRLLQTLTHIAAAYDLNGFSIPKIAVGVKHGNPCGAAAARQSQMAIKKMVLGDPLAIFGGLVAVNFEVDEKIANLLLTYGEKSGRRLLDGIIAPSFSKKAIKMLARKKDKCRFLANPALSCLSRNSIDREFRFRYVRGGFLRQPNYSFILNFKDKALEVYGRLSKEQKMDLLLAWAIGSTSNSNTITLIKDQMLLGNGVGQQDRVGGAQLALMRAKRADHDVSDSAAYSDSFFPFTDGIEALSNAGIKTILASSGSVRDQDIILFARNNKLTLCLVPDKTSRGFFGH